MRSGWHRVQAQGWRRLTDAKPAEEAGNPHGSPPFTGSLTTPPSLSSSSPQSLTHSLSSFFSGSFMHLPAPSQSHSLTGELVHSFLHSFTHSAITS